MIIPLPVLLMIFMGLVSFFTLSIYVAFKLGVKKGLKTTSLPPKKNTPPAPSFSNQILPLEDNFPFNASECRFIGSPAELVVFEGLSQGEVRNVIFCVQPSSFLNPIQDSLAHTIRKGRVFFQELKTEVKEEFQQSPQENPHFFEQELNSWFEPAQKL